MLQFIHEQPSIVERLLQHIETPSFADLLVRIVQLDEQPAGSGVLEVCLHPPALCLRMAPLIPKPAVAFS